MVLNHFVKKGKMWARLFLEERKFSCEPLRAHKFVMDLSYKIHTIK